MSRRIASTTTRTTEIDFGSGLLGTGPRGAAADGGRTRSAWQRSREQPVRRFRKPPCGNRAAFSSSKCVRSPVKDRTPAPFRVRSSSFSCLAFSDAGDLVFDPFMGSGTTMAAAACWSALAYGW